MFKHRKDARQRLKGATLEEYNELVKKANLTPTQEELLYLHIRREHSVINLALEHFLCETTIRNHLSAVYDKVAKL